MSLDAARALADAVMMEGYALYPFRASAPKNRYRWTFGVLAPRAWSEAGGCESWWLEAQLLVAGAQPALFGQLRFFQIDRRHVQDVAGHEVASLEHEGVLLIGWDEGIVQTVELPDDGEHAFAVPYGCALELHAAGRVLRERLALAGRISVRREQLASQLWRVAIRVENTTPWPDTAAPRDRAIVAAFASTHLVIGVRGGELISAIDPPASARAEAARCRNTGVFPVLVGPPGSHDAMLLAPFALYDHPQLAPESAGDLCDATEIDELLTLRTQTMTDAEKREARATDPRTAAIIARSDALPAEWLARMHGAARDLRGGEMVPRVALGAGAKVRLRPSAQCDAQDLLYAGHVATIAEIRHDVDGTTFFAVTVDDDPAAELHDWYGRYHYYRTDEVEPL